MVPATLKTFAKEKIEELYQLCAFTHSLILFLQTSLLEESQDAITCLGCFARNFSQTSPRYLCF